MYKIKNNTAGNFEAIITAGLFLSAVIWTICRTAGYLELESVSWPWAVATLCELLTVFLFIAGRRGSRTALLLSLVFILYSSWNIAGPDTLKIIKTLSERSSEKSLSLGLEVQIEKSRMDLKIYSEDKSGYNEEIGRLTGLQKGEKAGTYRYNLIRNDINREKKELKSASGLYSQALATLRSYELQLHKVSSAHITDPAYYMDLVRGLSRIVLSLLIFYSCLFLSHSLVSMFVVIAESNPVQKPKLVQRKARVNKPSLISEVKAVIFNYTSRPGARKTHAQVKT